MLLANIDASVWQWVATSAVGFVCVLLAWMLRASRDRLTRAEVTLSELSHRAETVARMCAVTDATVSNKLTQSIDRLQDDVRALHTKIEASCSDLGKKVDGVLGRLIDLSGKKES